MAELDFVDYHRDILPGLIEAGRGELLSQLRLPSLGIAIAGEGESFSYRLEEGAIKIDSGTDQTELCVELSLADWRGLVADLESVPGILYGGRLLSHRGNLMKFMSWEPALRALYTGLPIYDPASFKLANTAGKVLDPATSFSGDSEPNEMREFLDAAGYLLIKNVFSQTEVEDFRAAALELAAAASEGDQQSWWGRNADGSSVLCRCLNAGSHLAFARLYDDKRVLQLAKLLPPGMLHPSSGDKDGVTLVYKNPGVTEGLSDLPWHRDCGMGGHANMCPTYIISIYLYDATPDRGCLEFLPGSHRYTFGFADADDTQFSSAVTVPAAAGDITLHISDVMHAAPPPKSPTGPYRQSVLLAFHPDFTHHRGERHYNDVLLGADNGQVEHLKDMM